MNVFLKTLLSFGIGFAITYFAFSYADEVTVFGSFESDSARTTQETLLFAGYGFFITLVGVALGSIYRELVRLQQEKLSGPIPLRPVLNNALRSIDFYIGVVGAPIVYGLLWQSLNNIAWSAFTIIALQNGFAANAIVAQFVKQTPKSSG